MFTSALIMATVTYILIFIGVSNVKATLAALGVAAFIVGWVTETQPTLCFKCEGGLRCATPTLPTEELAQSRGMCYIFEVRVLQVESNGTRERKHTIE